MKKTILITGGCGFIGSHLVKNILELTEWDIVLLDRLDFSGSMDRVMDLEEYQTQKERVRFICWDLKAELNNLIINSIGQVDYIWHLASGSHVDRSIIDPLGFCMDNVVGTVNMLNYARKIKALQKFIYFILNLLHKFTCPPKYFSFWRVNYFLVLLLPRSSRSIILNPSAL